MFPASVDLLLACSLANTACAVMKIVTALILIIVSRLRAFSLVVVVRTFLQVLMEIAVNCYFQHWVHHTLAGWVMTCQSTFWTRWLACYVASSQEEIGITCGTSSHKQITSCLCTFSSANLHFQIAFCCSEPSKCMFFFGLFQVRKSPCVK